MMNTEPSVPMFKFQFLQDRQKSFFGKEKAFVEPAQLVLGKVAFAYANIESIEVYI